MRLATFFLIALFVHGPLSPLLPTAFESAIFAYVHVYPAWILALVGTAGATVAEAVNYKLIDRAAELPRLAALREKRTVRWGIAAFQRSPFWATVLMIFSPIPDTVVRILAPLGSYPLPKFLLATALGRFPRLFLIASVGRLLPVPVWALVAGAALVLAFMFARPKPGSARRSSRPDHRATACLVVALAMSCARASAGQEASVLAPGMRLRVTTLRCGTVHADSGTLRSLTARTLVLSEASYSRISLAVDSIEKVELSRGMPGPRGSDVLQGALLGAATAVALGFLVCSASHCTQRWEYPAGLVIVPAGIFFGGGIGAVAGYTVGSRGAERWESVPDDQWRVGFAADGRGRVALHVSVPF